MCPLGVELDPFWFQSLFPHSQLTLSLHSVTLAQSLETNNKTKGKDIILGKFELT